MLPAPRRRRAAWGAAVALLLLTASAAGAHWLPPEEIVAGLAQNPLLRDHIGVVEVHRDPRLPRLLIIKVARGRWDAVPEATRIRLAEEWQETWRHNVAEGIVAIVDAATDAGVVNYDGFGHPRLVQRPAVTPSFGSPPAP